MDRLEVPAVLAGLDVERDDGVAEQVVAGRVAAPVVGRGPADGDEDQAPLHVHRGRGRPHVDAGAAPPAVAPGVVAQLPGNRHGLEFPQLLAGPHVEGARIARHAVRLLRRGRADHRDVAGDGRNAAVADAHVHIAIVAEGLHRLAGRRVEREHSLIEHDQDAGGSLRVPGPIGDAPARSAAKALVGVDLLGMDPDFFACVSVEGDDVGAGGEVHYAPDHQRRRRAVAMHRIGPRGRQLRHVGAVDVGQGRKSCGGEVAIDGPPVAVRDADLGLRPGDHRGCEQRGQAGPYEQTHGTLSSRRSESRSGARPALYALAYQRLLTLSKCGIALTVKRRAFGPVCRSDRNEEKPK